MQLKINIVQNVVILLKPEAYDEIKSMEEKRIETLEQKYENDMKTFRDDMNNQLSEIMLMIQQNPKLSYRKTRNFGKDERELNRLLSLTIL